MRCPKCGYISFDHVETCLKCNKDIKKASEGLEGAVFNVAPPAFLKFDVSDQADDGMDEMDAFVAEGEGVEDGEIQDPDLDILLDDTEDESDDTEIEFQPGDDSGFTLDLDDDEDEDLDIDLEDDTDEGEITLDLGGMDDEEDVFGGIDESDTDEDEEESEEFTLDLPDELSDMSDLEPPAKEETAPAAADDDLDLSLDLDLGDDFDLPGDEPADSSGPIAQKGGLDDDLDLGDLELDLPDPAASTSAEKKPESKRLNLDDDLDFDLDLGDLNFDDK